MQKAQGAAQASASACAQIVPAFLGFHSSTIYVDLNFPNTA